MNPKYLNDERKEKRQYDLTECDLELLEALLRASPSWELKEAIYNEIQKRKWPPPGLPAHTRHRHKQRSLV